MKTQAILNKIIADTQEVKQLIQQIKQSIKKGGEAEIMTSPPKEIPQSKTLCEYE